MDAKIGRNDPCPCGSGKKYKQCCLQKKTSKGISLKGKIKAVWINNPAKPAAEEESNFGEPLNLMERTYGNAITAANEKPPQAKPLPPMTQKEG